MIVITGGGGYIGSLVAAKLPNSFVIDHKAGNAIDKDTLDKCLPQCSAVIHLAGTHYAFGPGDCYKDLQTFITLCCAMREHGVRRLVLCSSAAVYGDDVTSPVSEEHQLNPSNAYGHYKLMCEQIAADFDFILTVLRPFNASGGLAKFIPYVKKGKVTICGDGSAVRDFVSADDVAEAFVLALGGPTGAYNIGSGVGYSLNEVIALQGDVEVKYQGERPNDPKVLVADISKAKNELGWSPKHSLKDILCE